MAPGQTPTLIIEYWTAPRSGAVVLQVNAHWQENKFKSSGIRSKNPYLGGLGSAVQHALAHCIVLFVPGLFCW